jgi:ATP-binding cassette subfamily B protein
MQRISEILAEEPDIAPPATPAILPARAKGHVRFDNVAFAYPDASGPALNGVSFEARPGETLALVGPSGAGKSTVFRLALRLADPTRGRVLLDGIDARDADPRDWRARFSWVSQTPDLFTLSAAQNIALGAPDASPDAIARAAARAEADGFLARRTGGLDGGIGDRGRGLSGGERQRVAIARALLRDAPVLLLDEATSALDAENERLIQKALDGAMEGRTTLVIAHRLATVRRADRILVFDQGRIVEEGDHDSLVAAGGLYARLARLQFADGAAMEPA